MQRNTVPVHEEKGWRQDGTTLRGQYRTTYKAFAGRVEDFETYPRFFIVRPPKELLNGPHAPCYQQRSEYTYEVHWAKHPQDAIAGILRIEYDLTEALTWERQSQSGNF